MKEGSTEESPNGEAHEVFDNLVKGALLHSQKHNSYQRNEADNECRGDNIREHKNLCVFPVATRSTFAPRIR